MVSGRGFVIAVPAGWDVKRTAGQVSAAKGEELVSVRTVALKRVYRAALAAGTARELDRVAAEVARGLNGKVTTTCSRCPAPPAARGVALTRGYDIRYGDLLQQITFVLVDKREYQLTCRRKHDADGAACAQLRSSFRLA